MANHAELRGRGRDYPPEVAVDLVVPPNLDPRVQALSSRLTARKDPVDAAASVETWLSKALAYSRDLSGESQDPIGNFLFRTKKGHCELFSSAMVILLRAAGIPARNVTGYYGGTETDSGYVAIRAGDAHSWVEVYFPGAGFVPFDPTPSAGRGARTEGLWAKAVRSEEHTSELQSPCNLVCRLLLEKKKYEDGRDDPPLYWRYHTDGGLVRLRWIRPVDDSGVGTTLLYGHRQPTCRPPGPRHSRQPH